MLTNIIQLGLIKALILFLMLIFSISVHESAHAFVSFILGDPSAKEEGRISLNPIRHFETTGFLMLLFANIGWGKPVIVNYENLASRRYYPILIALAGPASNIILALSGSVLLKWVLYSQLPSNVLSFASFTFYSVIFVNISLFVFNLLPIPPLDGSKILRLFLPYSTIDRIDKFTSEYGLVLIILVILPIPFLGYESIISIILSPLITNILKFIT